jgi:hypothetical protein
MPLVFSLAFWNTYVTQDLLIEREGEKIHNVVEPELYHLVA